MTVRRILLSYSFACRKGYSFILWLGNWGCGSLCLLTFHKVNGEMSVVGFKLLQCPILSLSLSPSGRSSSFLHPPCAWTSPIQLTPIFLNYDSDHISLSSSLACKQLMKWSSFFVFVFLFEDKVQISSHSFKKFPALSCAGAVFHGGDFSCSSSLWSWTFLFLHLKCFNACPAFVLCNTWFLSQVLIHSVVCYWAPPPSQAPRPAPTPIGFLSQLLHSCASLPCFRAPGRPLGQDLLLHICFLLASESTSLMELKMKL